MRLFTKSIATIGLAGALALAPAAYAQSPSTAGYSQPGGTIDTTVGKPTNGNQPAASVSPAANVRPAASQPAATTQTTNSSGNLPFTGLDVGLIVLAGALLLAMGLGMRRVSRPSDIG